MRSPSDKNKLHGHSLPEIRRAYEAELFRVRGMEVQATDQVMARSHLTNVVILWFLGRPECERDAIVRAGAEIYRRHLESDAPIPIRVPDGSSDAPEPTRGRGLGGATVEISEPAAPKTKSRKAKS